MVNPEDGNPEVEKSDKMDEGLQLGSGWFCVFIVPSIFMFIFSGKVNLIKVKSVASLYFKILRCVSVTFLFSYFGFHLNKVSSSSSSSTFSFEINLFLLLTCMSKCFIWQYLSPPPTIQSILNSLLFRKIVEVESYQYQLLKMRPLKDISGKQICMVVKLAS